MPLAKIRIWTAVEKYTGLRATRVELEPDPGVPGTVAIQAQFGSKHQVQFLLQRAEKGWNVEQILENLEECQFSEWPPKSHNCQPQSKQ